MAHRHEADYITTQVSSKIANLTLRLAQSFVANFLVKKFDQKKPGQIQGVI